MKHTSCWKGIRWILCTLYIDGYLFTYKKIASLPMFYRDGFHDFFTSFNFHNVWLRNVRSVYLNSRKETDFLPIQWTRWELTFLAESGIVVSLVYIGTSRSLTLLLILGARESERPPSGTERCVGLSGCDSAMKPSPKSSSSRCICKGYQYIRKEDNHIILKDCPYIFLYFYFYFFINLYSLFFFFQKEKKTKTENWIKEREFIYRV